LVERQHIYEVKGRTTFEGKIIEPLQEENIKEIVSELKDKGYDAVAVCFLHSYRNPEQELKVKEYIEEELDIPVSLSSDIAREWREYERTSTTIINAYIAPIVRNYLTILEKKLVERGYKKDVYIM